MVPLDEHPDSIAIVGMAAQLPGAANVTEYWRNLREGVESIVRHTREEMLDRGARPDLVDDPNYVNASAPLENAEYFDAAFFGYSSREASIMEPQHRLFLQCAYHAMEDAAYDTSRYEGVVGVYGGCTMNTYLLHNVMSHTNDVVAAVGDLQTMVGNDKDYITTRVSHRLDLRGPSVAVQTACSTSLVAVHMACRALLDSECDMALAGGASVRIPHAAGYLTNPGGTSSPDGHCRAFDADAAGSVVGNGVGVVVLKRFADAVRDGDRIHAVIRGSAVNNDGQTKASFTAPSVDGQYRAVTKALGRAGVSARDISFVEAHGTGTPLGDPIEVAALTRAYRESTDDIGYCWLGSVKPNIGHLDAAAGISGLIKTVLALKHRQVPPVVNFRRPNPNLDLEISPFDIPTDVVPLDGPGPLLASVNSLAMGGTNAHLIVQEAPPVEASTPSARRRHPIVVSAHDAEALEALSQAVGQWARENPGTDVADTAYTLATGRRQLRHRRLVVADDLNDVASALSVRGSRRRRDGQAVGTPRVAFLFPGQGAQRIGMGAELADEDPVFAHHLTAVLDQFGERAGLDLRSRLWPDGGDTPEARARLADTEIAQPALFAVEWALGRTLMDYGVTPYAMLGHSVGELVAATLAGVLSLPDAVDVVAARGQAMSETGEGTMLFVNLAPSELLEYLDGTALTIAAINAERLVVVSGSLEETDALETRLHDDGVTCGRLEVGRAFHSPHMEPAAVRLVETMDGRLTAGPDRLVVSNVTGEYLTAEQALDPEYWADHVRRPVRFADGLRTLANDGVTLFVEVGPGRGLRSLVAEAVPESVCLSVPIADGGSGRNLADVLGDIWLSGGDCDWAAWYQGEQRQKVAPPLYPFARTRHWLEPRPQALRPVPVGDQVPVGPATLPSGTSLPLAGHAGPPSARTPMQRYLTRMWFELLGTEEIDVDDNFFDLGGHSLLAMQMVTQIRKDGPADLPMTVVFEIPTITQLAEHLENLGMAAPADGAAAPASGAAIVAGSPDPLPAAGPEQPDEDDPELAALLAEVDGMSDDEVRAKLAELEGGDQR